MNSSAQNDSRTLRVFLVRGLVAILWAVVFATAIRSVTTEVTVAAGVLLVVYPLIDAVATFVDARGQQPSSRRPLLINAASGVLAAVALGIAASIGVPAVFAVFGVWAGVTGAAQLIVVLRRRRRLGSQWPLILANGFSVIAAVVYLFVAVRVDQPRLMAVAIYAATGGVEFVATAWLVARRRRLATRAEPVPSMP
ncbi:hypothetical protein [Kribbella sp. CA-247076]|uniref:hypothetical protein n=1 Tax=Kribbella sp. CA-247076 TaxID=3239941 RepID=UPI003D9231B0